MIGITEILSHGRARRTAPLLHPILNRNLLPPQLEPDFLPLAPLELVDHLAREGDVIGPSPAGHH